MATRTVALVEDLVLNTPVLFKRFLCVLWKKQKRRKTTAAVAAAATTTIPPTPITTTTSTTTSTSTSTSTTTTTTTATTTTSTTTTTTTTTTSTSTTETESLSKTLLNLSLTTGGGTPTSQFLAKGSTKFLWQSNEAMVEWWIGGRDFLVDDHPSNCKWFMLVAMKNSLTHLFCDSGWHRIRSMYGIFTYIYLKFTASKMHVKYMDTIGFIVPLPPKKKYQATRPLRKVGMNLHEFTNISHHQLQLPTYLFKRSFTCLGTTL